MDSKALLIAAATLLALSAVSCGKDDTEESSVSISISEEKTTETAEESTEETTTVSGTETATTTSTTSTDASGTATTSVSTDTTDTATTTTTSTSQPEETTQQVQNEQPENNNDDNNNDNQDDSDNNQQDNNNNDNNNGNGGQSDNNQQKEVKFNINHLLSNASDIVSNLGTPDYEGGGASCLTNGHDDKIYQYDGLEIQCYIDGDIEYIFQITITGGGYQTDKGIKVGSSRAEVEAAYGTGTESGNYMIYSYGDNEMDIQYDGDTVISIFFYTPV